MIHKSEKVIPVAAIWGHCGTGAVMNILNYFWGTTFSLKDTFDIETLIRHGHFDFEERPSETEICEFLLLQNFKVEVYSKIEKGNFDLFINDQKSHQKKFGYIPHPQVDMNSTVKSAKFMRENKNFFLEEDKNLDIDAIIKEKSDGNHMFIFGVYSNILYNFESEENIGHIIASPGYESGQDKITLLETSPNAEKIFIEYENIVPAMLAGGGLEEITIISLTA